MLAYILRRLIWMVPTLLIISLLTFVIIQLPPGDFLTALSAQMAAQGEAVDAATLDALRERYGLGQPFLVQYWKWISGIVTAGDFGQSFEWNKPVGELIWDRLGLTLALAAGTLSITWSLAIPIGIYSAVRKYSIGDTLVTLIGFVGLATPSFLLALVFMYFSFTLMGGSVGGLMSQQFIGQPWSAEKLADLAGHLWIPVSVLAIAGMAELIRILRANLLDELGKPYVITARAKGQAEGRLLMRYPVRVALNPFISKLGWMVPVFVSSETVVSVVLSLPSAGPMLLRALVAQDMYLAGSLILMISVMTLICTLVSDILLAVVDPRIRFE